MGPTHTDGGYFRSHGRGRGPRSTPHLPPDPDVSRESMLFRRALRYWPAREVERFPKSFRRTFVQDGPRGVECPI